jgi:hypothetical protein
MRTVQSCSLTLSFVENDAGVAFAIGTPSATLIVPDGGTKNVTEGMFDIAVADE